MKNNIIKIFLIALSMIGMVLINQTKVLAYVDVSGYYKWLAEQEEKEKQNKADRWYEDYESNEDFLDALAKSNEIRTKLNSNTDTESILAEYERDIINHGYKLINTNNKMISDELYELISQNSTIKTKLDEANKSIYPEYYKIYVPEVVLNYIKAFIEANETDIQFDSDVLGSIIVLNFSTIKNKENFGSEGEIGNLIKAGETGYIHIFEDCDVKKKLQIRLYSFDSKRYYTIELNKENNYEFKDKLLALDYQIDTVNGYKMDDTIEFSIMSIYDENKPLELAISSAIINRYGIEDTPANSVINENGESVIVSNIGKSDISNNEDTNKENKETFSKTLIGMVIFLSVLIIITLLIIRNIKKKDNE